jgi:hypothetical protein
LPTSIVSYDAEGWEGKEDDKEDDDEDGEEERS